ncbi:MAG: hypothetical protein AMS24_03395 [Chlamydiae bacterium SM23_39]|nr:MAG: hypothetical protein AMS24_03395 [Chlamydiae bacterium SM23_39]
MNKKGWIIALTGSLFFFYAFFQANIMTPLNESIVREFKSTSLSVSILSAWYFYANIIFIIPAGLALDRFSVKKLMMLGFFLAIIGTIIFASAQNIYVASIGRFFCGIMMAFGLVACLKLASLWIPSNKMAIASSLIVTIGMLGGIFSQTPISILLKYFGWRSSLYIISFFGIFLAIILFFVIKEPKLEKKKIDITIFKSLKEVFLKKQNWYSGFFICLTNLPVAILGALFGTVYLVKAYNISDVEASKIVSMLFLGMLVGSPFFGWFSDIIKLRKIPIYLGAISCLILMIFILYSFNLNLTTLYIVFFCLGFTSASQILGYPVISESNPPEISGAALSFAAFIIMGVGYGLGLPFVGWLIDRGISSGIDPLQAYVKSFLVIPLGIVIALIMGMLIKETRCSVIYEEDSLLSK